MDASSTGNTKSPWQTAGITVWQAPHRVEMTLLQENYIHDKLQRSC